MNIAGMQKSSTIDFPGNLACVLFTRGCNMDCFYCHNRALLSGSGPLLPQQEVAEFLQRRAGLLDGVVISGGEPTLQPDLQPFLQQIKSLGYQTKLDTNGQLPEIVAQLLEAGLLDYVAVDVKAKREDYQTVTGRKEGFDLALETLALCKMAGIGYEARTTVYAGLREQDVEDIARALPQGLPRWRLNPYRLPEEYRPVEALRVRLPALTKRDLEALLPALRQWQPGVVI